MRERSLSRRGALASILGAGGWLVSACAQRRPRAASLEPPWKGLGKRLRGSVVPRGAPDYEARRRAMVWNARTPERRPDAIVTVADVDDVRAAVRFAREEGLRVAVRGGGHSWCGAPLREGGLLVDLGDLRGLEIDRETRRAGVEPAVRGGDLARRAALEGLAFPVGHCPGVPLGGYLLSGGFGWNVGSFGPACASVAALELVDAGGELLEVDERRHPDLFWAARGAGPGFFGVVTRFWLRLHGLPRAIRTSELTFAAKDLERVVPWLVELSGRLPSGVELVCRFVSAGRPAPGAAREQELVVGATAFADDAAQARAWLEPVERGCDVTPLRVELGTVDTFDSLGARMARLFGERRRYAADVFWSASDPRAVFAELLELVRRAPSGDTFALAALTPPPAEGTPPPPDMAFALSAPIFVGLYGIWDDPADDGANAAWLRGAQLRTRGLQVGHYVGESDLSAGPERARASFPPATWERLAEVKRRYDPQGRFHDFLGA